MANEVRCTVCGTTRLEHAGRQHMFTTELNDLRPVSEKDIPRQHPALSTDVVLRIALVNAGVITADDIIQAEQQLGISRGPVPGAAGGSGG